MGAHNECEVLKVNTNEGQTVRSVWDEYIEELYHQYGHDAYNGTFTTCSGMKTVSLPDDIDPTDHNAVFDYLWDNTEKWEHAKGVMVSDEDGIETWLFGGWAAE
jgi:hypothetical protein